MNTTEHKKLRAVLLNRFMGMALIDDQYQDVVDALLFAEQIHDGMRKDGKTPEFYHQFSILGRALTLHKLMSVPSQVYVAILLHDCPEDYPSFIGEIKRRFPRHSDNALALSKYEYVHRDFEAPHVVQKTMEEYMAQMANSPVLSIVKLLDRLHNLSTMLGVFTPEKITRYTKEVEEYFLPMLKKAKRNFPAQEAVYEIIKSDLNLILHTIKFYTPQTGIEVVVSD